MVYKYEVALSFAGEDRAFAEAVATALRQESIEVFYDNFSTSELWGEDLSVKLRNIYYAESRYCIMILSPHYLRKMWTSFERQQAIERLMQEKGGSYILPIRLDGFSAEVPGLSQLIGHLPVRRSEPRKVVDNFLAKIGRSAQTQGTRAKPLSTTSHIPNLRKAYTDRDKDKFLKESFDEIVSCIESYANDTCHKYQSFEHEVERITSRKVLFSLYNNGQELTRFKIWFGGGWGNHTICLYHGRHIDIDNDSTMNESLSIEEDKGELKLKPMGMATFRVGRSEPISPQEAAEYIWQIVCKQFS